MNVIGINGSPRKTWNTATLLSKALEGASSQGATTQIIHLYDLNFKGCVSCFACKLKGGKSHGKCSYKDDLTPILEAIHNADALILGSPIYFGNVSGEVRSFMERLLFQYLEYDAAYSTLFTRKLPVGLIFTMNVAEDYLKKFKYDELFQNIERSFERYFGSTESIYATDTFQFDDYAKYETTAFNEVSKAKRRQEVFPKDCQKAFEMGARLVSQKV